MAETREPTRIEPEPRRPDAGKAVSDVKAWFVCEVLPLEAMLMNFLHHNWRNRSDLEDLRQEVYAQVLAAAENGIPDHPKAFLMMTARNLLIDRIRREQVVPIDAVADLDLLGVPLDVPGPDRSVIARDVLRKLHGALDRLPPRSREAVILRRLEGLSRREIANRMGISEKTVAEHITHGMRALADMIFGRHGFRERAVSGAQMKDVLAQSAYEINSRAAAMLERRDFGDWSEEDEAELEVWLAQSQAHRAAYWRLEAAWDHTRRLAALNAVTVEAPADRKISPWLLRIAATIAVAATLGMGTAYIFSTPQDRTYKTGIGGHEVVSFADGSKIDLNTDTVLRARMTTAQRVVWLEKGEAYFEVKHDATHPFIVIAGNHRVTDLGTKFVVHRHPGGVEVALLEGSAEFSTASVSARAQSALLMPGDVATGTAASISVTKKSTLELSRELGWRNGVLVFKHTALADAVVEFNRYNRQKLVVADLQTGRLTIGGTFKAHHIEDFTQLVQMVLGLHVENKGQEIVISR